MSSDAAEPGAQVPAEWDELELSVRRLLDRCDQWRRRAADAESHARELQAALREYSAGETDPIEMKRRLEALERENRTLRERLESARGNVERILGRLEFIEEAH